MKSVAPRRNICDQCKQIYLTREKGRRFCETSCYKEYQKITPSKSAFPKGNVPWNKEVKGIHLSPSSEFKKGQPARNYLPVGSITTRTDENGKPRQHIKIADPKSWEEYAKYLWKQAYSRLIKGDVVHHINGIHNDDRIENLIALPRAEHVIFHSRWGIKHIPDEAVEEYKLRYTAE